MIEGFVEAVEPFQVRGWVFDSAAPGKALDIEIWIGDHKLVKASAGIFRQDLLDGNIGDGRHAFVFNFDAAQTPDVLAKVVVGTRTDDGWIALNRLVADLPARPANPAPFIAFDGCDIDGDQEPVFVLGAARSGTSAIAQALLKCGYEGHQEGHLLDLLAVWSVGLNTFFNENKDDHAGGRDTLLSRFSSDYMHRALDEIFVRATRAAYGSRRWIDKTPNSNAIFLAPRMRRIWPRARFVFMRRRFFENSISRAVKFPSFDFSKNCWEWAQAMNAWSAVKSHLSGSAVEIDQRFLSQYPLRCARVVGDLLKWSEDTTLRFGQALEHDWPERTSKKTSETLSLSELNWSSEQLKLYKRYCIKPMQDYCYTEDKNYSAVPFDGTEGGIIQL